MNKVFIGMVLAVCVLGMALLMLNERLARKTEVSETAPQAVPKVDIPDVAGRFPPPPDYLPGNNSGAQTKVTPGQIAAAVETLENKEAKAALAPPLINPEDVRPAMRAPQAPQPPELKEEMLAAAAIPLQSEAAKSGAEASPPVQEAVKTESAPKAIPAAPVSEAVKPVAPSEPAPKPVATEPASKPQPPTELASKPAPAKPARQSGEQRDKSIEKFVVFARDKGATIRILGTNPMSYKSMTLENPNRVVVDLDGDWKFPERLPVPKNELVNSVRIGKVDNKTRVVIDLKEKPRTSRIVQTKTGDGFDVRVDK